jgi:hypothetical protein
MADGSKKERLIRYLKHKIIVKIKKQKTLASGTFALFFEQLNSSREILKPLLETVNCSGRARLLENENHIFFVRSHRCRSFPCPAGCVGR